MTSLLNETFNLSTANAITLSPVTKGSSGKSHETLAEFVGRVRRERGLSLKDAEMRSNGEISSAYISQIENGHALNPSTYKLKVLASVLRVNEDEMFHAARGTRTPKGFSESRFHELFEKYDQIENPEHKRVADALVDGLERMIEALPKRKKTDGPAKVETIRKPKQT